MQARPSPSPGLQVPMSRPDRASPNPNARPPASTASPYPSARPGGGSGYTSPMPPSNAGAMRPYTPQGQGRRTGGPLPYPRDSGPPQAGRLSLPAASSVYPTPQTAPGQFRAPGPGKRIVVCCDGTWLDSDSSVSSHHQMQLASNVTRLGRAVKPESSDGITQIVYYQAGVGTEGGTISRVAGGATAEGLSANIREAYAFICLNYSAGDEIFLVGFSRGAFTARSVGGLIGAVGLLTKTGLNDLGVIFKDVEHRNDPSYVSPYPDVPFPSKPSAMDPKYARELRHQNLTRTDIPIKAIAVWDTVGSLGIPRVPWLERLRLQRRGVKEYTFYDTALGANVANAFQALALDEHRASFVPTLWEIPRRRRGGGGGGGDSQGGDGAQPEAPPGQNTVLRQVWFPGVHSNVGGGYPDPGIQNITFAWMIAQLEPLIDFNSQYLQEQARAASHYYDVEAPAPQINRPWSFGFIYRSMTGLFALAGRTVRTPGQYTRMDPQTGTPTTKALRDTCEYVHASVRARVQLEGPGAENRNAYEPPALREYSLRRTGQGPGGNGPPAVWESKARKKGAPRRVLSEAPLFATELRLLGESPEVQEALFGTGPGPGPGPGPPGERPSGAGGSGRRRHRRDGGAAAGAAAAGATGGAVAAGGASSGGRRLQRPTSQPSAADGPGPGDEGGGSGRRRRRRNSSSRA